MIYMLVYGVAAGVRADYRDRHVAATGLRSFGRPDSEDLVSGSACVPVGLCHIESVIIPGVESLTVLALGGSNRNTWDTGQSSFAAPHAA